MSLHGDYPLVEGRFILQLGREKLEVTPQPDFPRPNFYWPIPTLDLEHPLIAGGSTDKGSGHSVDGDPKGDERSTNRGGVGCLSGGNGCPGSN